MDAGVNLPELTPEERSIADEMNARMPPSGGRPRHYGPDGEPLTLGAWAVLFERRSHEPDAEWWKLGDTRVGRAQVSTVWIGLDHSFGQGPPLIFETMIFGGAEDGYQRRYSTREEATRGHTATVLYVEAMRRTLGGRLRELRLAVRDLGVAVIRAAERFVLRDRART